MRSERLYHCDINKREYISLAKIKQKGSNALTLSLSGGGALFGLHLGAMMALWEQGINPDVVVGTSAGSLAATIAMATDNSDQVDYLVSSIKFMRGVRPWTQLIYPNPTRTGLASFQPLAHFVSTKLSIAQSLQEPGFTYPAIAIVATDMDAHTSIHKNDGAFVTIIENGHEADPSYIGKCVAHACTVPILGVPEHDDTVRIGDGAWCMYNNTPLNIARRLTPEAHHLAINLMPPKTHDEVEIVIRRGKRFSPSHLGIFAMSSDIATGYHHISQALNSTLLGQETMKYSSAEVAERFHKIPTIIASLTS